VTCGISERVIRFGSYSFALLVLFKGYSFAASTADARLTPGQVFV
jgi:hypothetical protein